MSDTPPLQRLDRIEIAIERLTQRQEALAQSVELMQHHWEERWTKMASALQQDAENIRALARIAEIH
ncbi:MAG TPA: hypothetical protein VLY24_17105 [Bryobacteraceae bacterium]|nr:hypothetical protein [Bryobacteraceae bacterium]